MTPKAYFDEVWQRCELFAALHGYMASHVTAALQPDELLRAEWASRVSALDLYVHELVAQNLLRIFEGYRPVCPGFERLQVSGDALMRIQAATSAANRSTAFDLEVRTQLSRDTFQYPDDIADAVRLISPCKLWNEVALKLGATTTTVTATTESLKKRLSLIVDRRNKIVHEGDLQPTVPRTPWPISKADVSEVAKFINDIVSAIDSIV
jgi:RiboL-PSP-HEPN